MTYADQVRANAIKIREKRLNELKGGKKMNYDKDLSQGLVDEILDIVYKYEETMMLSTALGCLDIVKMHLLTQHMEEDDE